MVNGSAGKESACNAGDLGLIPRLGGSPGEGNGYPLQYSGLKNSMDLTVIKSQTRLSDFHIKWSEVSQSCLTLSDPMDSSLHQAPSVQGIFLGKSTGMGCRCGSAGKESACNMGDLGSIPGLGRSPGEGKGYPLQYLPWRIPWAV